MTDDELGRVIDVLRNTSCCPLCFDDLLSELVAGLPELATSELVAEARRPDA